MDLHVYRPLGHISFCLFDRRFPNIAHRRIRKKQREIEYLSPHGRHHEVSCVVAVINESSRGGKENVSHHVLLRSTTHPNTQPKSTRSKVCWIEKTGGTGHRKCIGEHS